MTEAYSSAALALSSRLLAVVAFLVCGACGPVSPPASLIEGPVECDEAPPAARVVFAAYCADCHAGGAERGGFGGVLDARSMIAGDWVRPGDASRSTLFKLVAGGEMPPVSDPRRLGEYDIDAIEKWIECGAQAL